MTIIKRKGNNNNKKGGNDNNKKGGKNNNKKNGQPASISELYEYM